ncbi:phage baseplate assembly protein [Desulfocurvibacter africanus]|uniref:Mu-like prophage tail protein gpP n=1 Tax=Desulfocurvibacter africanus subsp. africanus str. Walvis Bay TaxID=690850 RepID=F3Z2T9_DESAF|nr:Mu-like prophage tail protein gpP [Desulfocurvibacter africanus]EGJ50256.1 Mu-like prophage tail protein gpP [Desulfocurvibacter africanus subsp. africanus str. Walvis Bay]
MARVELYVAGFIYEGWQGVTASRHLEALCGGFSLSVTDAWAAGSEALPIGPGVACELRLDGETVISGYVDEAEPEFGPGAHSIGVAGRDRACDMVDCSAVHDPGEWANVSLVRLAEILAQPFGVSVSAVVDTGAKFSKYALEPGETAWEALERACRQRGVLCVSDARGGIVLTRHGQERAVTALEQGVNVLSARGRYSLRDRYSLYVVQGQRPGTEYDYGLDVATVRAECRDPLVERYRPLLRMAETGADTASARSRVQWEAAIAAARGSAVQVTVQGWTQGDGSLWRPNLLVPVRLPYLRLDAELLIAGVQYTLSERGTLAELDLRRPDAYAPEPKKPTETDMLKDLLPEDFNG